MILLAFIDSYVIMLFYMTSHNLDYSVLFQVVFYLHQYALWILKLLG